MKFAMYFSVLLISSFIKEGSSLRCWECKSDSDWLCADPFNNATIGLTDCTRLIDDPTVDPTRCRKASRKENGKWVIFRSCGLRSDPDIQGDEQFCTTKSGPNGVINEELCVCIEDGCNTSSTIKIVPLLLICPIFLSIFQF